VALVRVYCGLASADSARPASAESQLTVAVVDDAGRLLDVRETSDDPAGYAQLSALLVERSSGSTGVAIAADSDDHLVTSLLTAAGRPLAIADDDAVDDYAERFADDDSVEEMQFPHATRRAVGLARALQAGALSAVTFPASRDLVDYKPVLAAHTALSNGRHFAAIALREVLRELYPAALRAYPDPAQQVPLAVLDALPEPGRLGGTSARSRETSVAIESVVAQLAGDGIADEETVGEAVTALQVAIAESPRRGSVSKPLTSAVAETVRQAVAAVRACDAACDALVSTLAARVTTPPAPGRRSALRRAVPVDDTLAGSAASIGLHAVREPVAAEPPRTRAGRRSRQELPAAAGTPVVPQPLGPPPVAPPPVTPPPVAPRPVTPAPVAPAASAAPPRRSVSTPPLSAAPTNRPLSTPPTNRPVSVPPPPPPGITPIMAPPRGTVPPAETGQPFRPTITTAAINSARAERQRTVIPPRPNTRSVDAPGPTSGFAVTDVSVPMPTARPKADTPEPGSRAAWPLVEPPDNRTATPVDPQPSFPLGPSALDRPAGSAPSDGRVKPPWQADDLPAEPPTLRLVEPTPLAARGGPGDRAMGDRGPADRGPADRAMGDRGPADRGMGDRGMGDRGLGDNLGTSRYDAPPLRLVDTDETERPGRAARRRATTALDRGAPPPVADEGDGDLLIFAAARSAWFTAHDDDTVSDRDWSTSADNGWRAAEQAAQPAIGAETTAGLPKRVPQANLVPGSPLREERPLRIVRDAASIAAHTTGYFRGWRRGQEIGGYAIGGRPGRESAGGWDFTRENGNRDDDREYEFRSAGYPS
jgi:hypothetical protein